MRGLAVCIALALAAPADAGRLYGLVIGIDDYAFIPDLHGAVNDAEDIADALSGLGGDVTLLTDAEVTRKAVLDAWEGILDRAQPGDQLIISYAGHGSNEPEHTPGSERDGRDENFLLTGFAPRGAAAAERIRDDEIAELLTRSADLNVIFVADACHAGTVTRDLNPVLGYRYVSPAKLEADPLPPPPPPSSAGQTPDQVALFLAAVNETEKVPEILVDGVPRGALSYAFADGLRGAADVDGNGQLTKGELELHVRRTVRDLSDGAQLPQSEPAGFENRALLALGNTPQKIGDVPAEVLRPIRDRVFSELPKVPVSGSWAGVSGIREASTGSLVRDGSTVYSSVGDAVAQAHDFNTLQSVLDKHRLIGALRSISSPALSVTFDQGDRTYLTDQILKVAIRGRQNRTLTLFNLGADGTIAMLYPDPSYGDPSEIDPVDRIDLPVRVTAPFGADHIVAMESTGDPDTLRNGLIRLSESRDMARLWDLIRFENARIALFPFFTAENDT